MADFQSPPHDGHHDALDPGNDWRSRGGIAGMAERYVSYGNWAGPGNRLAAEHADPALANDRRYAPIDGLDAAAERHDVGYAAHDGGADPFFSWRGLRNVREDDRRLVSEVDGEMGAHGGAYSPTAQNYSEGLRGFFGARVMGGDAVDWAGAKASEAGHGIAGLADDAAGWGSLGDAGRGLAGAASKAGGWLADTAGDAWQGVSGAAKTVGGLGWPGLLGAVTGFGDVALAGLRGVAGDAWDGARGWLGGGSRAD